MDRILGHNEAYAAVVKTPYGRASIKVPCRAAQDQPNTGEALVTKVRTWRNALRKPLLASCLGLAILVGFMQLFRTRQWRILAGIPFTLDAVLFIILIAICLIPAVRRRHNLQHTGWLVVGSGSLFFAWSAISALSHPPPSVVTSATYDIPNIFLIAPLLYCIFLYFL